MPPTPGESQSVAQSIPRPLTHTTPTLGQSVQLVPPRRCYLGLVRHTRDSGTRRRGVGAAVQSQLTSPPLTCVDIKKKSIRETEELVVNTVFFPPRGHGQRGGGVGEAQSACRRLQWLIWRTSRSHDLTFWHWATSEKCRRLLSGGVLTLEWGRDRPGGILGRQLSRGL